MVSDEYVQFGCAWSVGEHWRNFDCSPTLRFERLPIIGKLYTKNESRLPECVEYGDIVAGLPIKNDSCKAVYCSHVLEHLALNDCRKAIKNTHAILRQGSIFRFVLPDLEHSINQYVNDASADASIDFLKKTLLGREVRARGLKAFVLEWLGNARHMWMWDYKSMERELTKAGFTDIRRAAFDDSSDPMFKEVEDENRWENALGIECRKA